MHFKIVQKLLIFCADPTEVAADVGIFGEQIPISHSFHFS